MNFTVIDKQRFETLQSKFFTRTYKLQVWVFFKINYSKIEWKFETNLMRKFYLDLKSFKKHCAKV